MTAFDYALYARRTLPVALLVILWCWESGQPFLGQRIGRMTYGMRNVAIAVANTLVLAVFFSSATALIAEWTQANQVGLLNLPSLPTPLQWVLALLLLDLWMYGWHRANHAIPLLWRFHRMHHSDSHMDVTTATRFHLGELTSAAILRLALIPLLGLQLWHLVVYETLLIAATQFHHANISIGRLDPWLRWLIVTPDMHKVHHSDWQPETDSNFASVLSVWDCLFGTFRMRADLQSIVFGLKGFTHPYWQQIAGMANTPFHGTESSELAQRVR